MGKSSSKKRLEEIRYSQSTATTPAGVGWRSIITNSGEQIGQDKTKTILKLLQRINAAESAEVRFAYLS